MKLRIGILGAAQPFSLNPPQFRLPKSAASHVRPIDNFRKVFCYISLGPGFDFVRRPNVLILNPFSATVPGTSQKTPSTIFHLEKPHKSSSERYPFPCRSPPYLLSHIQSSSRHFPFYFIALFLYVQILKRRPNIQPPTKNCPWLRG